jgi:hypothetical protein
MTDKTFLANTIRNTSSYNRAILKQEEEEKRKLQETRLKPEMKIRKKKKTPIINSFHKLEEMVSDPAKQESFKKLGALVNHSKLKVKKTKKAASLYELMGGDVMDEGAYGPLPGQKISAKPALTANEVVRLSQGLPNEDLPDKCPW